MKLSLGEGGGGRAPALTARKLGMIPRIRLGCCCPGAVPWLFVAGLGLVLWPALFASDCALSLAELEVPEGVAGAPAPWSCGGTCGWVCAGESWFDGGVVCCAELSNGKKLANAKQAVSLVTDLINNDFSQDDFPRANGWAISNGLFNSTNPVPHFHPSRPVKFIYKSAYCLDAEKRATHRVAFALFAIQS